MLSALFGNNENTIGMSKSMLNIAGLSIGYSSVVCKDINAVVEEGELVGLAGRNGAGKSTLIKSILGLGGFLKGNIFYQGEDLLQWTSARKSKEISIVFSRLNQLPPLKVIELVCLGRLPYHGHFGSLKRRDLEIVEQSIKQVQIEDLKMKYIAELSDGQLQMVMIARALAQDTKLVIMDEPTSHLDIENQFKIFELIYRLSKETGKTFIVASHQVELLLHNSSQLWWIDQDRFFSGFPEQIAFEHHIFDKLSQKKIQFDYIAGRFKFQYEKAKVLNFQGDNSELAYWTKHALERKGYDLNSSSASTSLVRVAQGLIHFNDLTFTSIEELINKGVA